MDVIEGGVSVVIPAYNGGEELSRAVRSAVDQSAPVLEVLVVDDGSTDGSCDALATIGPQVTVIRQSNGGTAAARNAGIRQARGEFIALLDQDDLWDSNKIAHQLSAMTDDVAVVHAGAHFVDQEGRVTSTEDPVESLDLHALLSWCVMLQSSALIRASALQLAGAFDTSLSAADDWDMWIRLAERGTFRAVPETLTTVRVHSSNQSHDPELMRTSAERLIAKHRQRRESCPDCLRALDRAAHRNRQEYYRRARDRARARSDAGDYAAAIAWTLRGLRRHPRALIETARFYMTSGRRSDA